VHFAALSEATQSSAGLPEAMSTVLTESRMDTTAFIGGVYPKSHDTAALHVAQKERQKEKPRLYEEGGALHLRSLHSPDLDLIGFVQRV
jgi:hypothetical protein